jgi:hypothetical protein
MPADADTAALARRVIEIGYERRGERMPDNFVMARGPVQPAAKAGGNELVPMRWGLIPYWWAKPLKQLPESFNARAESVADKPMFRDAFNKKSACCLLGLGERSVSDAKKDAVRPVTWAPPSGILARYGSLNTPPAFLHESFLPRLTCEVVKSLCQLMQAVNRIFEKLFSVAQTGRHEWIPLLDKEF